jgi:hypothetical protein
MEMVVVRKIEVRKGVSKRKMERPFFLNAQDRLMKEVLISLLRKVDNDILSIEMGEGEESYGAYILRLIDMGSYQEAYTCLLIKVKEKEKEEEKEKEKEGKDE